MAKKTIRSRPVNFTQIVYVEEEEEEEEESADKAKDEESVDHWDDGRTRDAEDSLLDMNVPEFEVIYLLCYKV